MGRAGAFGRHAVRWPILPCGHRNPPGDLRGSRLRRLFAREYSGSAAQMAVLKSVAPWREKTRLPSGGYGVLS